MRVNSYTDMWYKDKIQNKVRNYACLSEQQQQQTLFQVHKPRQLTSFADMISILLSGLYAQSDSCCLFVLTCECHLLYFYEYISMLAIFMDPRCYCLVGLLTYFPCLAAWKAFSLNMEAGPQKRGFQFRSSCNQQVLCPEFMVSSATGAHP